MIAFKRKIGAAILSSLVFAIILGGFEGDGFYNAYYLNFMFAMTYGIAASSLSDWISKKVVEKKLLREIISFLLHCVFGGALLYLGLISATSFFLSDRLLQKVKFGWLTIVIAISIVVLAFVYLINR